VPGDTLVAMDLWRPGPFRRLRPPRRIASTVLAVIAQAPWGIHGFGLRWRPSGTVPTFRENSQDYWRWF